MSDPKEEPKAKRGWQYNGIVVYAFTKSEARGILKRILWMNEHKKSSCPGFHSSGLPRLPAGARVAELGM